MELTHEREEKLDSVIKLIQDEGAWCEDYYTSNTDNTYADYCTWGWKESDLDLANLDDYPRKLITELKKLSKDYKEILVDCSDVQYIDHMYSVEGEIFSVMLGETHDQLSEDAKEAIESLGDLSSDDLEYLRINSDYWYPSHPDYIVSYFGVGCRWSLVLDTDILEERISELKD